MTLFGGQAVVKSAAWALPSDHSVLRDGAATTVVILEVCQLHRRASSRAAGSFGRRDSLLRHRSRLLADPVGDHGQCAGVNGLFDLGVFGRGAGLASLEQVVEARKLFHCDPVVTRGLERRLDPGQVLPGRDLTVFLADERQDRAVDLCQGWPRVVGGCMSAFAGYAHGSKSSIGEPGDSVLECGGRGALENGVPSREGQIMDGTTIELTEKLERLLREAAQVSVDLDRAKGTIVGVPHYSVIEARAHELGQQLSRQIQLRWMSEISAQASSSAKCPACGTGCELGRKKRRVTSIDGPLVVEEPVGHCPRWSSGL